MIKIKALINFLVLSMVIVASLSVCIGDNSASSESAPEVSIYNSTSADSMYDSTFVDSTSDSGSDVSIYNSTNILIDDSIIDENINDDKGEFLELVEYKKVPIDDDYSKNKLQKINVSDDTLEAFSRFGLWLDDQKIDAKAEDINVMYIDDDLRVIENYWIFATRPESKERNIEIIQNSQSKDPSPDEMITFLKKFDEKYPIKYVRTGLALFVTVENKDVLLSELSKEDIQMFEAIKNALLEGKSMDLKWGSSNPNIHADMSGWAAQEAGFDSYYTGIISRNASEPDNVSFVEILRGHTLLLLAGGVYTLDGLVISAAEYIRLKNYNHYYDPKADSGAGFGGAPLCIEDELNLIYTAGTMEEKAKHLSFASHLWLI
ncbi:hypothetical protein MmiAt1_09630 [Methanimicrococcus sp. At1]|uniref:Uncharacterized protein n=1 Tax=Methanimicrococcus hacksteinii TaxID=3028293 RepID=A0ABU3VQE8_9EURY|nr:hypothetical protein [Methanimicrococcus sp. At1]MDV0445386.1 hypothetical protein [Methanimicrococcus sp. At1]